MEKGANTNKRKRKENGEKKKRIKIPSDNATLYMQGITYSIRKDFCFVNLASHLKTVYEQSKFKTLPQEP